ncbi:hypothetical protein F2Q68_00040385 [Brassica cretica]|uniref:RRM domain-containing protein n=1 Tax=Brassica cretica TaxID=69181 RepID=A0A8S9MDH6_BRACR|nr:hypothetical protein F2Q68_00040385 [Brassica cretica]
MRPSKTLFVINFDADNTRTRDLERHFEPYGKIVNVRIRRNFAFVQYEEQEDATRALDATNNSKLMDKVISVEYAMKDDDARGNGHSPERRRDRSPERRRRSPSPYKRERGSPDYGRGGSPVAAYKRERTSPDYGRRRSPSPYKRTRRSSPEYGRDRHRGNESPRRRERGASPRYSRSPDNKRERVSPDHSPFKKESSKNGDGEVDSPNERRERSRSSPENGQVESPGSIGRRDSDGGYDGADSPMHKSTKSGKGFEATFDVLARLIEIKFASGIIDELLYLDHPREHRFTNGLMMLEYRKAVQETVHEQFRVVREGHLRIIFSQDLKILTWEFCARRHEELLLRRLIAPQVNQLLQVAQKCQSTISESGSEGVYQQDLQSNSNMVLGAGRQLAKFMELQSLNDLGYPKRYIRTLQISEVVKSMKDLMNFTGEHKVGPIGVKAAFGTDSDSKAPETESAGDGAYGE